MREYTTHTTQCSRPGCHRARLRDNPYCPPHLYSQGLLTPRVQAQPAIQRIDLLTIMGYDSNAIASAAGIHRQTIARLRSDDPAQYGEKLTKRVRDGIMSTTPARILATGVGWMPAWPSVRKLRALKALGMTHQQLADGTGISTARIKNFFLTRHRPLISMADARSIDAFYRANEFTPQGKRGSRSQRNWAPPLAWENINDPTDTPFRQAYNSHTFVPITTPHRRLAQHALDHGHQIPLTRHLTIPHVADGTLNAMNITQHVGFLQYGGYPPLPLDADTITSH